MYELTTLVNFEAAHRLPNYQGKCSRLHGHNWKVEVTVTGNQLDELGMLIDFKELNRRVNEVIATLDHYYLNEIEPFCQTNPTAENIARYIFEELNKPLVADREVRVTEVTVWESSHSAAVYREGLA